MAAISSIKCETFKLQIIDSVTYYDDVESRLQAGACQWENLVFVGGTHQRLVLRCAISILPIIKQIHGATVKYHPYRLRPVAFNGLCYPLRCRINFNGYYICAFELPYIVADGWGWYPRNFEFDTNSRRPLYFIGKFKSKCCHCWILNDRCSNRIYCNNVQPEGDLLW